MTPHRIEPDVVAPVRAEIREYLSEVAEGTSIRRAVEAIELLGC
jgi:hypothetical protein